MSPKKCLEHFHDPPKCQAKNKLVYIKTHKTGSTTLASILERFGYTGNLTMAVPEIRHGFPRTNLFNRSMVWKIDNISSFDMLTNHARYNRPELDALIPNATYITILRHPLAQFESMFGFFNWGRHIHTKDPIATFVNDPKYINATIYGRATHNSQLFDLGLSLKQTLDEDTVNKKIQSLNKEMDLVLITEYFDESLLILRDLLCWSVDDILYISNGVRSLHLRRNFDRGCQKGNTEAMQI
ncbi:galactosylceramide sulfotransferase-like [Saccoglossus kowalevskii]|uniref:Galactosylceramide sulfotransferase-like n=1 Tax=Saccoglossus kowalevskii TaxID=10224 RepID=A0ABM0M2K4_SACKO|nr:PREDICTED: galactosylceramide sulfotransferase-like [Saccoglossus kowalevskii]